MEELSLDEFMVLYSDFSSVNKKIYSESLYSEKNPESSFYRKREFLENKLTRSEERPSKAGIPLQTQYNISRLLSPLTLNDEMLLFHGLGSGKCVVPSSMIRLEDDIVPIENIWHEYKTEVEFDGVGYWSFPVEEIMVKSVGSLNKIIDSRITRLYMQEIDEDIYTIYFSCGRSISGTRVHKVYTSSGWLELHKLQVGDSVKVYCSINTNAYSIVSSISIEHYRGFVYDLEVENVHNYFCNGVLTHNTCSAVNISELSKSLSPLRKTLVLLRGGTLKRNFVRELAFKCTDGKYIPENYKDLTKAEKIIRLNKLVGKDYELHTFETFAKNIIDRSSDIHLEQQYSNRVIIIDEVHNIRLKSIEDKSLDIYDSFHRFLHLLKNRKIVLLSATPMRDRPEEFASIMNLILPIDKQLPTGKKFIQKYFSPTEDSLINIDSLKEKIRGRVSYVRSMESSVVKNFKGVLKGDMKVIKVYPSEMSEFQTKNYSDAYNSDVGKEIVEDIEEESGQGLYDKSRQASLFVFPDGSYGSEGFSKYFILQKNNNYTMSNELKNILTDNGKATVNGIIENISKYSSIYGETIKKIKEYPNENVFVYNKYVQGSGSILFCELLKLVGFERTRGRIDTTQKSRNIKLKSTLPKEDSDSEDESESEEEIQEETEVSKKVERFALITGESATESEVDRIIDSVFNDPDNKYGDYIRVIVGSQVIGEGKSLKNIRQIHIQTPHWNNSETEQAIGRGIRAFSHNDLSSEERYVKVYRHCSFPTNGVKSVNYTMYKLSEEKEIKIKYIERLCKESSVDCLLNFDRNYIEGEEDGSRECDYTKCKYKCDYYPESKDVIEDTYNLYYAQDSIESIITILKQLFRKKFYYLYDDIVSQFDSISKLVILRSLKYCIENSITFINRYGFPSYLREENNFYFLVDRISLPNSFYLSYYNEHPTVRETYKFEDVVTLSQYAFIDDVINYMTSLDYSKRENIEEVKKKLEGLNPIIRETFIENAILAEKRGVSKNEELRKIIIDYHKNFITKVGDKTTSTLLQEYDEKIRCLDDDSDEWYDCDESIDEEIKKAKEEEKGKMEENPYGYYGIIARKKNKVKFKIMKVEEKKEDSRLNPRGAVCEEMVPITRINDVINSINMDRINIKAPIKIKINDKNDIIKRIHAKNPSMSTTYLSSLSDDDLSDLYYWYFKSSKKDMCSSLQKWFLENKLLMYEN